MVRPELIGIMAVALLFLITVPFFSVAPSTSSSGGAGSDLNQVKVSASDTVADYLFSKLQAGSGISLSIQNPGGDENILISATGAAGDTNCSVIGSCRNVVYQNQDANLNTLIIDGNILAKDANSNIGSSTIPFATLFALRYQCLTSPGGSCMDIPINTFAFTSGAGNGFAFNTLPNRFNLRLANTEIFIKYAALNASHVWLGEPTTADPGVTGGVRSGTLNIRTTVAPLVGDYNTLTIYDGNQWREVGSHLQEVSVEGLINGNGNMSISGSAQIGGGLDTNFITAGAILVSGATGDSAFSGNVTFNNDVIVTGGTYFGSVLSAFGDGSATCDALCDGFDGAFDASNYTCVYAMDVTAAPDLCSNNVKGTCVCKN